MAHLVGKPAPAITGVKDQDGNTFDSNEVIGKTPVVLFFYPQAMTTGCELLSHLVKLHIAEVQLLFVA